MLAAIVLDNVVEAQMKNIYMKCISIIYFLCVLMLYITYGLETDKSTFVELMIITILAYNTILCLRLISMLERD
ncbi:hypothetical protein A9267_17620 [Shewanella sp. UCD-FRSSP16_17]|nr:hypothetical protein A9267_17620 [Shewanella sp. UCD-FRSSP16_17]